MSEFLKTLKKRRIALGLKQNDMLLRVGISRQQYQRLESKGNPRLDTLELIAKGLKSELMLIPQEKLLAVKALLENDSSARASGANETHQPLEKNTLANDLWKDLLGDESYRE
ncbi:helix-turn-helix transcriptional regulator [Neptunomonas sp.]|uniref:helix-turn-helix transcriptional regulator n=1 Tax=Neptunomonas sp. TaxID=1971898 RepID=UPI003561CE0E